MPDFEVRVEGDAVRAVSGWTIRWLEQGRGIATSADGRRRLPILIEGSGPDRVVTVLGRRLSVSVRTARERMLAEAEAVGEADRGPAAVAASLPGLVVSVSVSPGSEVKEGDPLVTIEAMKMQNVIRAPRGGTVSAVEVVAGQRVMAGDPILRIG